LICNGPKSTSRPRRWRLPVKHGTPATHPLTGRELRALRRLHREGEGRSPFLFLSERGAPMAVSNFAKLMTKACAVGSSFKGWWTD
jgi:integrase